MFPPAEGNQGIAATTYGPLPDHVSQMSGYGGLAVVYHTTETVSIPSYAGGDTAPHYTYEARAHKWWHHQASCTKRVGTLRGHSHGGHSNCKAIQVEIVCYSDKSVADGNASRIWVGDLTAEHLEDLAEFYAWCVATKDVRSFDAYGPAQDFKRFDYGAGSSKRLSDSEWYQFSGLTAHGGIPNQSHWDTGELDLWQIAEMAEAGNPPPLPPGDHGVWAPDHVERWA